MAKTVVVGVGGGIAAYKTATVCSMLGKAGYRVQVLMTPHATKFVQPLTFQALTRNPVIVDTFAEPTAAEIAHISVADSADAFLIAPATANLIAKLAHGIADDMVTTTALASLAPLIVAPAMNVHMLNHPAVQDNLEVLRERGAVIVDPGVGPLACGYTGKGRLAEPEDIVEVVLQVLQPRLDLAGLTVVVTAGPTIEDIDPVRYISNPSTGKMGYALARAAVKRGAKVELISGPTVLSGVPGATLTRVRSTEDMFQAVQAKVLNADIFISAAAPCDFRAATPFHSKWKKSSGIPELALAPTTDILATIASSKPPTQIVVGFAAETDNVLEYARQKLQHKNLDLIVANQIGEADAGFAADTNRVTMIDGANQMTELPCLAKEEVAERILDKILELRANRHLVAGNQGNPS